MAGGALIFGWKYRPFLVSPLAAALSLVLIYLVGVELGLTRGMAITGATMLAFNPTFCLQAIQPVSDGLATCWSLAAILTALRSRRREAWGLAAGAAFGMAFLVRPSNVLLLIPILFSIRLCPKTLLLFFLGGLPFAGVFCAWFGVFLLFYSCYFYYAEWWYTRFLLPGMPALILGTLLVVRDLGKLIERSAAGQKGVWLRRAAVIILIGVALGFERQSVERFRLLKVAAIDRAQADFCRQSDSLLPRRALLIATETNRSNFLTIT